MALNVSNLIIGEDTSLQKQKEVPPPAAAPRPVTSAKEMRQILSALKEVNTQPDPISSIKEPSVVVDGKVKKISKKSAFLLDMLSLDD